MLEDDLKQSVRQIAPGMDVCDVSGEKVGTVTRVHRPAVTAEVFEVKTGPFGLGKHLYVPADEVEAVTEAGLILRRAKQEFHDFGLDAKPDDLTD
jgi:hypothetical protein